ncbi:WG containing repeat-containing protein [Lishizhenia tianjinensis]|uniref:WG containing repeat-containing protein n=1 Tax=Lishizhenia tianjinensis TaxID=477690 RepID=A0A1I7BP89_9FLAO|nr:WG repeat-containing protein [Lishizhenia tianjinensis]SFT88985.1 WG containing repeat-containing protein [Lishizhenia tianjinensis]
MKYLILFIVFISAWSFGQFPILKDGRWGVINEEGQIIVQPKYRGLSVFKYGLSVAKGEGDKFGLVNLQNEVVLPLSYDKIEVLGPDLVRLFQGNQDNIYQISTKKVLFKDIEQASAMGAHWFLFRCEQQTVLLHTQTVRFKVLDIKPTVSEIRDDLIAFHYNDKGYKMYFDAYLNSFVYKSMSYSYLVGHEAQLLSFEDSVLFYKKNEDTTWQSIQDIHVRGDYLYLSKEDSTTLYSKEGQITATKGCITRRINKTYFEIKNGAKHGVVDSLLRPVLPMKFERVVYFSTQKYFQVEEKGRYKLYTEDGRDLLGKYFDQIRINLPIIKGYTGTGMTQYYLQDNKVVGSKEFENVVSVYGFRSSNQEMDISFREEKEYTLPDVWYSDTIFRLLAPELRTARDSVYIHAVRWGVKMNDSIIVSPRFFKPKVMDSVGFSWSHNRQVLLLVNHELMGVFPFNQEFTKVYHLNGEEFVRVLTPENFSVIRKDNTQEVFSVFQGFTDYRLGVKMTNGENVLLKRTESDTRFKRDNFKLYRYSFEYELNGLKQEADFIKRRSNVIVEKEFNFYDEQAQAIFEEAFTDAYPFQKGTAIVARAGKYGIIKADSVITPLEYSNIKRLKEFGDTLFKAYRFIKESVVYDAQLNQLPYVNYQPSKFTKEFLLLTKGREKLLLNQAGNVLYEGSKYIKFTPFEDYYFRKKRRMFLYGTDGLEKAIEMPEAEQWLSDELYLAKKGSKMAVIHVNGDTLSPFDIKEAVVNNAYILLTTGYEQKLYSKDFELVEKFPLQKKIELDKLGEGYLLLKGDKSIYYPSPEGKGRVKYKGQKVVLSGGLVFVWKEDSVNIFEGDHLKTTVPSFDYLEEQEDGVRLLMGRAMKECIAFVTANNQVFLLEENYSCRYLKNGFIKMRVRKQDYKVNVYNPSEDLSFLCDEVEGEFCDYGFLLVEKDQQFYFIDTLLEKQFYYFFEDAKPFVNGYAAVKYLEGWTLIDKTGELQAYPGYRELSNCGGRYFQTKESAKVGLIDAQGKEVIPPVYDYLEKVASDVVQVIQDGKVGYLRINGDVIYLPSK